jgi:hypothetical protein
MCKKLLLIFILGFIGFNVLGDTGYTYQGIYFNSWRTNVTVGQVIADMYLPVPLTLYDIVVGGDVDGAVVITINGYQVKRYHYTAGTSTGDQFPHGTTAESTVIPAYTHVIATLESGVAGYHDVSIAGHF